jgi:hypothetical protein
MKSAILFSISMLVMSMNAVADGPIIFPVQGLPFDDGKLPADLKCEAHPDDFGKLTDAVSNYFNNEDKRLKELVEEWSKPDCLMSDGFPMLMAVTSGMYEYFSNTKDWDAVLERINRLKEKYPKEPFVAVTEALYWRVYAWSALSEGGANVDANEKQRLFKYRANKAYQILSDSKPYASSFPSWYTGMLNAENDIGSPNSEMDDTFVEGATKFKNYYAIYIAMSRHLRPEWGGSWDEVDNLVKWAVNNSKDTDGTGVYARIYGNINSNLDRTENLFKVTKADWPTMQKSFEDIFKRWPNAAIDLNHYALLACKANDKKAFIKARQMLGDKVLQNEWPRAGLELCEAKYLDNQ